MQRINKKTPERFIEVFYDTIKENPNKWTGYDIYKNTIEKAFQVGGLIAVQHFFGLFSTAGGRRLEEPPNSKIIVG